MSSSALDPVVLADSIKEWGRELGFQHRLGLEEALGQMFAAGKAP